MNDLSECTELVELFNKIENKVETYLELKSDILENEYVEVLGDASKIIKSVILVAKFVNKKRFEQFLKGFLFDDEPANEQLNKLYQYINNESKAEFISNTIAKVLNSASKKAAYLMGLMTNRLVNSNITFSYKELAAINALGEMFDYDIDNISIFNQYLIYLNNTSKRKTEIIWFNTYYKFKKWCEDELKIAFNGSIEMTIAKCVANQLLIKEIETDAQIDDDSPSSSTIETDENYKFSEAGLIVCKYLVYLDLVI